MATVQGKRLLRASLLQPLSSVPTITARHDAIEELQNAPSMQADLQTFLQGLPKNLDAMLLNLAARLEDEKTRTAHARAGVFIKAAMHLRVVLQLLPVSIWLLTRCVVLQTLC
jgi:hypothetical protein